MLGACVFTFVLMGILRFSCRLTRNVPWRERRRLGRTTHLLSAAVWVLRPTGALELLLEREAEPGELVVDVTALDRRFEVELLDDFWILADQVANACRQHLVGLLP